MGIKIFNPNTAGPCYLTGGVANESGVNPVTLNTLGATLFVAVVSGYTNIGTITDSPGGGSANTWNALTAYHNVGGAIYCQISYVFGPTTNASHTFTVGGGLVNYATATIYAFTGTLTTSGVIGNSNGATKTTAGTGAKTFQAGSVTPTSGDIVVCGWDDPNGTYVGTPTIDANFIGGLFTGNAGAAGMAGAAAFLITTSGSALNPTWSMSYNGGSQGCAGAIACFHTVAAVNANQIIVGT